MNKKCWSFAKIWNDTLDEKSNRKYEPRNYIWSSELGGSMIDRYLKMTGIEPTNPPNARSRRKFFAGDIWEMIVKIVLLQAGILKHGQKRVSFTLDGCLRVSGKMDFYAGGEINWENAQARADAFFSMLENNDDDGEDLLRLRKFTDNIIKHLSEEYPNGLDKKVLEIKSTSSFMFEKYLAQNKPGANHAAQCYSYLMDETNEFEEGSVVYVCREDARILEFPILKGQEKYKEFVENDIKTISEYIQKNERPEIERFIVWDEEQKKFSKNWKVEYSSYLSMLYVNPETEKPFERSDEFYDYAGKKATAWNRVVKRIKDGKDMTTSNEEYIREMSEYGFNIHELI